MQVHPSGYYAWKAQLHSPRAKHDQRLLGLLKQAWLESGGVYGYRKLTLSTRDLGERCGNASGGAPAQGRRPAFTDGLRPQGQGCQQASLQWSRPITCSVSSLWPNPD